MYLFYYIPSICSVNRIMQKTVPAWFIDSSSLLQTVQWMPQDNHINTSHISFLLAGMPPGRHYVHRKSEGAKAAPCNWHLSLKHLLEHLRAKAAQLQCYLTFNRGWDPAQVSIGNCLKAPPTLHVQTLIYFNSTKLFILSQSKDGGTSFQHTKVSPSIF